MPNFDATKEPAFEIKVNGYDEPIRIFADGRVLGFNAASFTIVNRIPALLAQVAAAAQRVREQYDSI